LQKNLVMESRKHNLIFIHSLFIPNRREACPMETVSLAKEPKQSTDERQDTQHHKCDSDSYSSVIRAWNRERSDTEGTMQQWWIPLILLSKLWVTYIKTINTWLFHSFNIKFKHIIKHLNIFFSNASISLFIKSFFIATGIFFQRN
jgi:hypothetical protein